MNKKLTVVLFIIIGVLGGNKIYAQGGDQPEKTTDSNKEIATTFRAFFEATEAKDAKKLMEYIYPKLFEFVPKEVLLQAMEKAFQDNEIIMSIQNSKVSHISNEITIDQIKYAIISYSFVMGMETNERKKDNPDDEASDNDFSALKMTSEILAEQYGKKNVFYNKEEEKIKVNVVTKAIAIKENDATGWTFIEYKPSQVTVLEQMIPKEIIEKAAPAPKPCEECSTFKDALLQPEIVTSLIISKYIHRVNLDDFPSSIGQFKNLKILYLTGHSFTTVPKEIGNLQKLEELSLAECPLTSLPEEIFTLKNLKELLLYEHNFSDEYLAELKVKFKEKMPNTKVEFE